MQSSTTRTWLNPLTFLTFFIIGITGLLLLFHVRLPVVKVLHELIGIGFVVLGTIHVVLNWRAFIGCFKWTTARVSLGVGLLLCGLFVVIGLNHPEEGHGYHGPPERSSLQGQP